MKSANNPSSASMIVSSHWASRHKSVIGYGVPLLRDAESSQQGSCELKCGMSISFAKNSKSPVTLQQTKRLPPQMGCPLISSWREPSDQGSPKASRMGWTPRKSAFKKSTANLYNIFALSAASTFLATANMGNIDTPNDCARSPLICTVRMLSEPFVVKRAASPCKT